MPRSKLTEQQQRRQKERRHEARNDPDSRRCTVLETPRQLALVVDEAGVEHTVKTRRGLQATAGDSGWFKAQDDGVLVALDERTNALMRHINPVESTPVAANLDLVIIVAAVEPPLTPRSIDRALTLLHSSDINALVLLNKADLLADNEVDGVLEEYRLAGFETLHCSAEQETGCEALKHRIAGCRVALVGQSGVGKSSLLNVLCGTQLQRTAGLVASGNSGRHTTVASRLYQFDDFELVDSPGIRELQTWHLDKQQILAGFPEITRCAEDCRFHNCMHGSEPGCAVTKAVQLGIITPRRHQSYSDLLAEAQTP